MTTKTKLGRPRHSTEKLYEIQLDKAGLYEALKSIPAKKRTGNQMREMAVLSSYIRRIDRRISTGKW